MCSQKCASPGKASGSCEAPMLTFSAAAALSVVASWITSTFSLFDSSALEGAQKREVRCEDWWCGWM